MHSVSEPAHETIIVHIQVVLLMITFCIETPLVLSECGKVKTDYIRNRKLCS